MSLALGIVGLPNVGKSTLFTALSAAKAEAANYPFCTIEPNIGMVPVPDARLTQLQNTADAARIVPTVLRFVDIAGLVRGAHKGEGLGNQFLSHIREVDALAHVVRCFEDDNIVHVENRVDPVEDATTILTELCLKDLDSVQKRMERSRKAAKTDPLREKAATALCPALHDHLSNGKPARTFVLPDVPEAPFVFREMQLLTAKPAFYLANIDESSILHPEQNLHLRKLRAHAECEGVQVLPVCAALEAQIAELDPVDQAEFLESVGLREPGLHAVIRTGYDVLNLLTFFTAGKQEVHAWTVPRGAYAPQAAGAIHSDFEKGFIRVEVIACEDFVTLGGENRCREAGKLAIQGKDYVMRDGDVVHFRFNV